MKDTRLKRKRGKNNITEDVLAKMSDDDLKRTYIEIRALVNKGRRKNYNVKVNEIDLCYIQREFQFRQAAR